MRAPYGHRIFLGPGSQVLMLMHVSVSEEYTAAHSAEVLGHVPPPILPDCGSNSSGGNP